MNEEVVVWTRRRLFGMRRWLFGRGGGCLDEEVVFSGSDCCADDTVAYMRMPNHPSRRADAGMSTLRASTGMCSLGAGAGISPLSAGAGMSPLGAGAGMSPLLVGAGMCSPCASNWQPLEYIETPVWP